MKAITLFISIIYSSLLFAQDSVVNRKGVKAGFGVSIVQTQPQFPGGSDSLESFLNSVLVYPEQARINHVQGKVYVGFLVEYTGKIKNTRILSSVSEELDAEAMRVIGMMPDWEPGTAAGAAVSVQYILPIEFITPPKPNQQN